MQMGPAGKTGIPGQSVQVSRLDQIARLDFGPVFGEVRADQPEEFAEKASSADDSLGQVREALDGGPLAAWIKQQVHFDRNQVAELRREMRNLAGRKHYDEAARGKMFVSLP